MGLSPSLRASPGRWLGPIPHPAGRSGGAPRCWTTAWATAFALTASSVFAQDFGADVYNACGNSVDKSGEALTALTAKGWTEITSPTPLIRDLLADGVLASMGTTRDKALKWGTAPSESAAAAGASLGGVSNGTTRVLAFGDPTKAIVVAFDRNDNADWHKLHCIYAGPLGPEMTKFTETIGRTDAIAKVTQATDGLKIFTSRSRAKTDSTPPKSLVVDLQIGVFDETATAALGRKPKVPAGISLFRFTQR